MVTLTIELNEAQAEAMAQFYKRVGWSTFRDHAQTDDEANAMRDALYAISKELTAAGYNPR